MLARGPDAAGLWQDRDSGVTLGHRRLAIRELSELGAQPMVDAETGVVVIYNGELYDTAGLAAAVVEGERPLRSASDTELLLRAYIRWGAAFADRLRGMYAYVIWDPRDQTVHIGRDVYGIKPLYVAEAEDGVWFTSQVKALDGIEGIDRRNDAAGHTGFFLWGHVPEPFTMVRGVRAVPAGASAVLHKDGSWAWRAQPGLAERLRRAGGSGTGVAITPEALCEALHESVHAHLIADVPVGVFLSAGMDSTTLAALAQSAGGELRTLTLGFEAFRGTGNDEVPLAEAQAKRLGATHQTLWVRREDLVHASDRFLRAMDLPTIDGANTWLVAQAAQQAGLRVALSGLGADELFGGYPSFRDVPRWARYWRAARWMPGLGRAARWALAPWIGKFASPKAAGFLTWCGTWGGAYLLKRALFLPHELPGLLDPDMVREGLAALDTQAALERTLQNLPTDRTRVTALESTWYMRNQLLRDADWAAMDHSVEVRVPFVDTHLFDGLVPALRSLRPATKQDMAACAGASLVPEIRVRPKSGFTVPLRDWFLEADGALAPEAGLRGWARWVYARSSSST